MYPRLSDVFQDLFGFQLPFPIYSFGAMVALGVLMAAWLLGRELDRLYADRRIASVRVPVEEKGKAKRMVDTSPSAIVGTVSVVAVVAGFAGAKVFHILENLIPFLQDPLGMVFNTGGFTFYGGLIAGTFAVAWYVRQKGLSVALFADAIAPGLMTGYGIGRIGCHLAGDGDWGIAANLAARPDWLPMWLWAETYPRNILNEDLAAAPVYPTPLYEFMLCGVFFALLWSLRKHPFQAGWLFGLYLVFNGLERFLIELIRVNNVGLFLGIAATQAQVISVVLMVLGVVILVRTGRRRAGAATGKPVTATPVQAGLPTS
jgi:phosphatidylglycerol:prolipoprotein diacylglycerol transferase